MKPARRISTAIVQAETNLTEQNIQGPIIYDRVSCPIRTLSPNRTRTAPAGLRGAPGRTHALAERMKARTVPDPITGCHNFTGCKVGPNGYGQIDRGNGERAYAHRVAWELAHPGETIPAHLRVLHRCDNPRCVNPAHLWLGTQTENIYDSIRKGRYNVFGRQKLNAAQVREIRALGVQGVRHADIAVRYGIKRNTVSQILSRATWAHLPDTADPLARVFERVPFVHMAVVGELSGRTR